MTVLRITLALSLAVNVVGCTKSRLERSLTPPERAEPVDERSPYLKVHMKDGEIYVLSSWRIDESARQVFGDGERLGLDRKTLQRDFFTIPIDAVALFETNVIQRSPSVTALAVITGISVAVTAFCIANPKSCFGSCPTFYVTDGHQSVLQAEGFSASVSPSLEARDVDALYRARPTLRTVTVTMKNEALETHVVRHVRLLAAPRPPGGRVLATPDGTLREATDFRAPDVCLADEGDCRHLVEAFDGSERFSLADDEDLARRESIELRLPPADGPRGLVLASRQTLASTYLFYQSLAWLGRSAGDSLAALERGDRHVREALEQLRAAVGGIEILAETREGAWVRAAEIHEAGPLATDVILIPLPVDATGNVRLRLAKGHWRIDYLASAQLGLPVEPVRLEPDSVRTTTARVPQAPGPLITLPGDAYVFAFHLPERPEHYELFLDTQGYYLEWMREEWLSQEDPSRAAGLLLDPERALRDLAAEFKKHEAQMERLFWGSRYASPTPP